MTFTLHAGAGSSELAPVLPAIIAHLSVTSDGRRGGRFIDNFRSGFGVLLTGTSDIEGAAGATLTRDDNITRVLGISWLLNRYPAQQIEVHLKKIGDLLKYLNQTDGFAREGKVKGADLYKALFPDFDSGRLILRECDCHRGTCARCLLASEFAARAIALPAMTPTSSFLDRAADQVLAVEEFPCPER